MPPKKSKTKEETHEVEAVVDRRRTEIGIEYRIKWKGHVHTTWEPKDLCNCTDLINDYKRRFMPPNGTHSPPPPLKKEGSDTAPTTSNKRDRPPRNQPSATPSSSLSSVRGKPQLSSQKKQQNNRKSSVSVEAESDDDDVSAAVSSSSKKTPKQQESAKRHEAVSRSASPDTVEKEDEEEENMLSRSGKDSTRRSTRVAANQLSGRMSSRRSTRSQAAEDDRRSRVADGQSQPEMEQEKTSFMDLPDEILIQIFKYVDFPTRLNLRINKKLNQLQQCVKNKLEKIVLKIQTNRYELDVFPSNRRLPYRSSVFGRLVKGLNRLAINTNIQLIDIHFSGNGYPKTIMDNIVDVLSNFKADKLTIDSCSRGCLPLQVNVSTLLNLAQNIRHVDGLSSNSITAKDLCALRKIMLEGNCKLESFSIDVKDEVIDVFKKEYFGVTTIYSNNISIVATDTSIELYHVPGRGPNYLFHYEGDIQTKIYPDRLILEKCKGVAKPGDDYKKIEIERLYFYKRPRM